MSLSRSPFNAVGVQGILWIFSEAGDVMEKHYHKERGHVSIVLGDAEFDVFVTGHEFVVKMGGKDALVIGWPIGTEHEWLCRKPGKLLTIWPY